MMERIAAESPRFCCWQLGIELRHQFLRDFSVTCVRSPTGSFHCAGRPSGRRIADHLAPREGRKPKTMEGAGQRSRGIDPNIKAAVYFRTIT